MRRKLKLNESELRCVIKESVKGVLSEIRLNTLKNASAKSDMPSNDNFDTQYDLQSYDNESGWGDPNSLATAFGLIRDCLVNYQYDQHGWCKERVMGYLKQLDDIKAFLRRKGVQHTNLYDTANDRSSLVYKKLEDLSRQIFGKEAVDLSEEEWNKLRQYLNGDEDLQWACSNY